MAILIAGNAGLNVNNPEIEALAWADPVASGPNYGAVRYLGWLDEFTGSFQYDVFDNLAGGTLTGWKQTYNGGLVFEITGANVDVGEMLQWVAAADNATAVRSVFAGADHMTGSAFSDTLSGYTGPDTLMGGAGSDKLEGGDGRDFIRGEEGNDSILGGAEFDDLHGNQGNDTVDGGAGEDWVVGGQGNDLLFGGDDASNDVVYGNLGDDTCYGGGGIDWVRGGQGNDSLSAGAGDDLIWGDRGDDTISGGAGADIFSVFGEGGLDRILDFNAAEGDRLRVEAGYGYTIAQVGADTVVSITGGAQAVLVGVQLSTLPSGWLI